MSPIIFKKNKTDKDMVEMYVNVPENIVPSPSETAKWLIAVIHIESLQRCIPSKYFTALDKEEKEIKLYLVGEKDNEIISKRNGN